MRASPGHAAGLLWTAMVCLLVFGGPLRSETPQDAAPFARIQVLLSEQRLKEAETAARALLQRLDHEGSGASVDAARAIDLLLEALHLQKIGGSDVLPLARRAMEIRRLSDGAQTLTYAASLQSYARRLNYVGRPRDARPLCEEALTIKRKVLGPDHPEVGRTLALLASVEEESGDWHTARELYERSLAIMEPALGMEHRDSGALVHSLGGLLEWLGDHEAQRELFERRLRAFQGKTGVLSRLAQVRLLSRITATWDAVGDSAKAAESYRRARDIWGRVEAKAMESAEVTDIELANTLARLASTHAIMGEHAASEDFYLRAIRVREAALGPDHPDLFPPLRDLAAMLERSGHAVRARPYIDRACRILEVSYVQRPVAHGECLMERGLIMKKTGAAADALPLMKRGIDILMKNYGEGHPALARAFTDQAALELAMGRGSAARTHALQAETIARRHFQKTASWLSEREALRFEQVRSSGLDLALSSLTGAAHRDPLEVARVWDAVVRSRALVLDELAARRQVLLSSAGDPRLSALVSRLESERNRVARFVASAQDTLAPDDYQTTLSAMLEEKEAAEKAVAMRSASFRHRLASREIDLAGVIASLPERFAMVAYVRYERTGSGPSYLALVLGPSDRSPALVPLGDASAIDRLIAAWRQKRAFHPGVLKTADTNEPDAQDPGEQLRRAIWDPVARHVSAARLVLLVPDGSLHLVNLGALPDGRGGYLVESRQLLHQISAERDLVRLAGARPRGAGLLALGGPDYDSRIIEIARADIGVRTRSAPAAALGSLRFEPLPAAAREAEQIAALWKSGAGEDPARKDPTLLTRSMATEGAIKSLAGGHRVVHLATHGFIASPEGPPSLGSDNPLLAAGLALAGANARSGAASGQEDGLLLAEEIASRDLSGVEWVVLSSCESALGSVRDGEGVLGMRRAFESAGAGTLIMSLWPVEDEATRLWMIGLYQARLDGLSTAESMRRASVERIQSRRARGLSTHPFFWGAFVAAGDWR